MKRLFLLASMSVMALVSCQSELAESEEKGDVNRVTMSVKPFVWNESTRTIGELTSSGVSFKWAEGDEIGVFPNVGDQVRFPISEGAGTGNATFNGGGWALKSGYTYVAYYPFSEENFIHGRSSIPMTYVGQVQKGNGSLADISKCDYIVSNLTVPDAGEVNFQFSHLGALVRFVFTVPQAGTYINLRLSADGNVFPIERTLDLSGAVPVVSNKTMSKTMEMSLSNVKTTSDNETVTLYMLMPECNLSDKTITARVGDYTAKLAGKDMKGGKAYSYTATLVYTEPDADTHSYVDLGLPSGTLWATCNIGAENPEDFGDYFAWGEISPKEEYTWETYKFGTDTKYKFTKYSWDVSYWAVGLLQTSPDYKTKLDLEDDAAYVNWGGSWRVPSKSQCEELIEYTTFSLKSVNGVSGMSLKSRSNENSIFFPLQSGLKYYWTRNLAYSFSPYYMVTGSESRYFKIDKGYNSTGDRQDWRTRGMLIRAVCVPE